MDDDNADLYQLYHMLELVKDGIDDEDEFWRHRITILVQSFFQELKNHNVNVPYPRANIPWQALYLARNDKSFIATMRVDVSAFDHFQHPRAKWTEVEICRHHPHFRSRLARGQFAVSALNHRTGDSCEIQIHQS
ncbi:hypothetical protein BDR07DRAFT_1434835 [Suillus spraguei]|nr:hypothetical protein BDR07DRAFT_1434835 [Suillus spraguei]